jgi:hypothetical protein
MNVRTVTTCTAQPSLFPELPVLRVGVAAPAAVLAAEAAGEAVLQAVAALVGVGDLLML